MSKPKISASINPALERAMKVWLDKFESLKFEEQKQVFDSAIKLEALKLKAKGDDTGKFFGDLGGEDDDDTF